MNNRSARSRSGMSMGTKIKELQTRRGKVHATNCRTQNQLRCERASSIKGTRGKREEFDQDTFAGGGAKGEPLLLIFKRKSQETCRVATAKNDGVMTYES